jgi:rhodanese-related sulfurtransferase
MAFRIPKEITPQALVARLKSGESLMIVDVRESDEWNAGHIAGAKHIPLGQLQDRLHELESQRETFLVCRSGNRSGLACELLSEKGFDVVNMTGGLNAWTDELA